jgi:multidrug efflux system membrane fusion protein
MAKGLMRRLTYIVSAAVIIGVGAAVFLSMTPPKAADHQSAAPKPVPVLATRAQTQDVPIILRGLGTVTAFNAVALRSRVEGAITQVNFQEGQNVKKGDLLIQLDPRPYEAALDQAKANLTKDQALLANAKTDLARYSDLLKRNFTPEQQVATQQTTVAQDTAAGQSDEAAIKAAQLNVDYAALRSPIDGVTGIRQIDIGNIIQANSAQTLVMITQIEPIYVIFTLPEANIDRVRDAMAKGTLTIQAYAANDRRKIAEGKLDLIDNTVDQTTGTVKLKAEFKNADRALWPGQFVNAHAVLSTVHNGITVPSTAILTGPKGSFTYVIDDKSQVSIRQVTVLQSEANRMLIGSGLKVGEQVVTAGQFRLQPGAKVKVSDQIADAGQTLSDAPAGTDATE